MDAPVGIKKGQNEARQADVQQKMESKIPNPKTAAFLKGMIYYSRVMQLVIQGENKNNIFSQS